MLNIKNSFFLLLLVYSSSTMALAPFAGLLALASYLGIGGAAATATGTGVAAGAVCTSTIVVSGAATAATATGATITVSSAPAAATGVAAWWAGLSVGGKVAVGVAACAGSALVTAGVYKVHNLVRACFNEKELNMLNKLNITQDRNEIHCQQELRRYNLECAQDAEKKAAEIVAAGKQLLQYCAATGLDINAVTFSAESKALRDQYSIYRLATAEELVRDRARA